MDNIIELLYNPDCPEDLKQLALLHLLKNKSTPRILKSKNNNFRKVSSMDDIIISYGYLFTRAYRMDKDNFYNLHNILEDNLKKTFHSMERDQSSNYFIDTTIRLSIALRFFAGGDPLYLMLTHGVSKTSVYDSVWGVVDSINTCNKLAFHFPSVQEQKQICNGYKDRSGAKLSNIIGAIDGMLVWTKKLP